MSYCPMVVMWFDYYDHRLLHGVSNGSLQFPYFSWTSPSVLISHTQRFLANRMICRSCSEHRASGNRSLIIEACFLRYMSQLIFISSDVSRVKFRSLSYLAQIFSEWSVINIIRSKIRNTSSCRFIFFFFYFRLS